MRHGMLRGAVLALCVVAMPLEAARLEDYGKLPLTFEPNRGQFQKDVQFASRAGASMLYITRTEAVITPGMTGGSGALRMRFPGGRTATRVEGLETQPGVVNYFTGSDRKNWHAGIPTFGRVRLTEVWEGIDVDFYGNGRRLEFDFRVAAGANASCIRLAWEGAEGVRINDEGELVIGTVSGDVVVKRPEAFQDGQAVAARYELMDSGEARIVLGAYDRSRALVIDPVLVWSTLIGGSGNDSLRGLAMGPGNTLYAVGTTTSGTFPTVPAATVDITTNTTAVVVLKMNSDGNALLFSTILNGEGSEEGQDIAVDGQGNAYLTGWTDSSGYPNTLPPEAPRCGSYSIEDAFVTKLNASGGIVYSGCPVLSGMLAVGQSIAVDGSGAVVVGVNTTSNFPTTAGVYQPAAKMNALGTVDETAVFKLDPSGYVVFSTYLGSTGYEDVCGVGFDASGNIILAGQTSTTAADFPVTAGAFDTTYNGRWDAFVAKLNPTGTTLLYSTVFGGSENDRCTGAAIQMDGSVYLAGQTSGSALYPLPGFGNYTGTDEKVFVVKFRPDGSAAYLSYFNGSHQELTAGIAVDALGAAYVTGQTFSVNFQTTRPIQATNGGDWDLFLAKIIPDGTKPAYATYFGRGSRDYGKEIVVDSSGAAYVSGYTGYVTPLEFQTTAGAYQTVHGGGSDGFLLKVRENADLTVEKTASPNPVIAGQNVTYTITVRNLGPDIASGVTLTDNLPANVTFVSCAANGGGVCGGSGNSRTVSFAVVEPDVPVTVTLVAAVQGSVAVNTVISNTASVGALYTVDPVSINNDATAAVTVAAYVNVTIASTPSGLAFQYGGGSYTAPHTFQWLNGTQHAVAWFTPQAGATGVRHLFQSWSDSADGSSRTITVPLSAVTYSAQFRDQYYLTTAAGAGGTIAPASGWHDSGAVVAVSATADSGYDFVGFSGDLPGTGTPQNVTMTGPKSVQAAFQLKPAVKTDPVVTWATPAAIVYGTALGGAQLNASANVAGTFVYTPAAGTVLAAGSHTLTVNFTPTDTANYNSAARSVTLEVLPASGGGKIDPAITWAAPASITWATPLSAAQLNATANVAGTFVYTPAAGTLLAVGIGHVLTVQFTPADTAAYNSRSAQTTINVLAAVQAAAPTLVARVVGRTGEDPRIWTLSVTNYGPGVALGAWLREVRVAGYVAASAATCPITVQPVFPIALGDVAKGQSVSVPVRFSWPANCAPAARVNLELDFTAQGYVATGRLYNQVR